MVGEEERTRRERKSENLSWSSAAVLVPEAP